MISDKRIDGGKAFDWGKTSNDYARFRDIYPVEFYNKILIEDLCIKGQDVLDLGTGTGVLPRNMYQYGAKFVGTDITANQIEEAKNLSSAAGMDIAYKCIATEDIDYPKNSFDVITACQCFFYFQHDIVAEKLYHLLRPGGKLVILYMAWLPLEDKIARASEDLILRYNPRWTGCGETRHPNAVPEDYKAYFNVLKEEVYDLSVPFTRETWNGRMRACRGIGASLSDDKVQEFDVEHMKILNRVAPQEFEIQHYTAMTVLAVKK